MGRKEAGRKVGHSGSLGKALVNSQRKKRWKKSQGQQKYAGLHCTDISEDGGAGKLASVVSRDELDEFLCNALLSQQDFVAEREQLMVLQQGAVERNVLEDAEELYDYEDIRVPRRPKWDRNTTKEQLDRMEKDSFLEWRRELAVMEESNDKRFITPFEKNLEVWKQLWRVSERSDVVVQIVDARNPLLFLCKDVTRYVSEVDPLKRTLLIINKADYLSKSNRLAWARYLRKAGIKFAFWSAVKAQKKLDLAARAARRARDEEAARELAIAKGREHMYEAERKAREEAAKEDDEQQLKERLAEEAAAPWTAGIERIERPVECTAEEEILTHVLSREEMLSLLLRTGEAVLADRAKQRPDQVAEAKKHRAPPARVTVGMVGYPNVGKSSTVNVLMGEKKVSVAATPGKTKHFQTLVINSDLCLCDCPGLVFPTFMSSPAALVMNGIMPIDQMRSHVKPMNYLCGRISRAQFKAVYGIEMPAWKRVSSQEVCDAHAVMRGFMKDQGRPDDSRSARIMLKDVVKGKLLYCHPPPDCQDDLDAYHAGYAYWLDDAKEGSGLSVLALQEELAAQRAKEKEEEQAAAAGEGEKSDAAAAPADEGVLSVELGGLSIAKQIEMRQAAMEQNRKAMEQQEQQKGTAAAAAATASAGSAGPTSKASALAFAGAMQLGPAEGVDGDVEMPILEAMLNMNTAPEKKSAKERRRRAKEERRMRKGGGKARRNHKNKKQDKVGAHIKKPFEGSSSTLGK